MDQYVGLDVSQDETHICVVDCDGNKLWEGDCASIPEAIGETVKKHAPDVIKIGLESGHLSTWGLRIAKRSGMKKARIAVARKLAVIMHQMLQTGELFCFNPATGERAIYV